jgi:cellulose synthase/poly-beta-1,6-N-acetylglucosamine synthase-like glycosyltransferase
MIAGKLESLLAMSYPKDKCEIVVVDSGSTDNTARIVKDYKEKGVILLEQNQRTGKASAINYALQKVKGGIVVLTDANSFFSHDALIKLVQKFDKNTGAVLPRLVLMGKLSFWDQKFNKLHDIFKDLESKTDSVFIVFGELFAFRRELVDRVDEDAAADDLSIALTIRKKNYRIVYSPDVEVTERIPSSHREVRTQKTRRIFGITQAMTRNLSFFLNPKYSLYGMFIFPIHFIQITLGPFLVFAFLTLLVAKLSTFIVWNFGLLAGAATFGILLLFSLVSYSLNPVRKVFSFAYNFLATQVYIMIALVNLAQGRDYSVWEKISSTREISPE